MCGLPYMCIIVCLQLCLYMYLQCPMYKIIRMPPSTLNFILSPLILAQNSEIIKLISRVFFLQAKERCNGLELDGRKIRVDYSITKRAHTPTPGVYMGKPTRSSYDDRGGGGGGGRYDDDDYYDRGKRRTTWRERDLEGKIEEKICNTIFFFYIFSGRSSRGSRY